MENENITTCYDCEEEINMDEDEYYETYDGNIICESCRNDNYFYCEDCEQLHHNDECYETRDGRFICDRCYSDNYFTCNDCGDVCYSEDSVYIEDRDYYVCEDCATDNYYMCADCGHYYSRDSITETDDGYYCSDCYEDNYDEEDEYIIRGYHNRDIPVEFLYTEEDLLDDLLYAKKDMEHIADNLFKMGMEIEVENANDTISNNDMAKMIRKRFPHLKLVFEGDGSLRNGFEIITQPMTMRYILEHKDDFKELCKMLSDNGFQSHNGGRCGQHIHFSRVFFSDNDDKYVGKLLNFFERYKREIYKFSRRESTNWCAWVSDNARYDTKYYKSSKILCDYAKRNTGHGVAINLEHSNTIEIRVFRGTLKYETLMANFEFVNALIHTIKEKPTRQINFDKIVNYSGNEYLPQYCMEKGIYNSEYMSDETTNIFNGLQAKKDKYEEIKKDVKGNIENIITDMIKLTKDMIVNSGDYTRDNGQELNRLFTITTSLQNIITQNIELVNSSTLRENNEKIEDNYRDYIQNENTLDYTYLLRYIRNIKDYLPINNYTEELLTKIDKIIEETQAKYSNRDMGVEI